MTCNFSASAVLGSKSLVLLKFMLRSFAQRRCVSGREKFDAITEYIGKLLGAGLLPDEIDI